MPGDFNFRDLTTGTREYMLREIDQDIADDVLVRSKRFTEAGNVDYPPLLRSAASAYNEAWLAERLIGSFNQWELRRRKTEKGREERAYALCAM